MAPHDISSAVSSIIAAFHSLRDTVTKTKTKARPKPNKKKLNPNDRKRKHPKDAQTPPSKLTSTLTTAPSAIGDAYARGIVTHGAAFQAGDGEALASLAAVLVRLNTGLVDFISTFLQRSAAHGAKGQAGGVLDYNGLALLADASRIDSCRSLTHLRARLSRRARVPPPVLRTVGTTTSPRGDPRGSSSTAKPQTSNQLHWAFVRTRPRAERRRVGASAATPKTPASATTTGTPPYADARARHVATARQPHGAATSSLPKTPALSGPTAVEFSGVPEYAVPLRGGTMASPALKTTAPVPSPTPGGVGFIPTPPPPYSPPRRFPSTCTTTTTSTRLGEIPLHRWAEVPDFEEMERLNKEELARLRREGTDVGNGKRRGLFARLFRGTAVA